MNILALDLSTKTGWACFKSTSLSEGKPLQNFKLESYGLLTLGQNILAFEGLYPYNVRKAAWVQADAVTAKALELKPDVIVIENTVPGRQALSQRFLEWLHYSIVSSIGSEFPANAIPKIVYLKTGVWRHAVGLAQTKEDAKNNRANKKLKEVALTHPELAKELRKKTGVRGAKNKKHYAVRMVNELFGLNFKLKDNDIADSILLGLAYIQGATPCDGT